MGMRMVAADIVERNGRCFEISQEDGFIGEVDCPNPTADLLVVLFVVGLVAIWWFGYGPGARKRREEEEERERVRREFEESPRRRAEKGATSEPSATGGQRVLSFLTTCTSLLEEEPEIVSSRLLGWLNRSGFDEAALAEARLRLEAFPIRGVNVLVASWSRGQCGAAARIIDNVRTQVRDEDAKPGI